MRQYIHLLTNEALGLPTDLWLPTTNIVKPEDAWQTAIGVAQTVGQDYEVSVESYYKEMQNVIAFKEGASLFQFSDWQSRVTQGKGTAYGLECFVQKKTGRFSGWIGYTLAWAWRQFPDLNQGVRYPYKYDRRHDFEIVGAYQISPRVKISATWVYSTGNTTTLGTSKYLDPGTSGRVFDVYAAEVTNISSRNNFRLRDYHRLDIGIDFTKQKRHHQRTWSFGAYNAYSRANPFFMYLDNNTVFVNGQAVKQTSIKQSSLFPIIPYFSYNFKF
jgi:hypothetical protein